MSKRYNAGKFMNVGAVIGNINPPVNKKENIFTTDAHISKKVYKNQEGSDYGWINELPSTIKREYSKMSKAEKALFWLTGFALLGVAGYASSDTVKKTVDDNAKKAYDKLFSKSGGKSAPIAPVVVPAVNASVTPTITPQPKYDYYDKDFKVGIMIEGDRQFKQNVTNLINIFKQTTPDDYKDLIYYAPKRIAKSEDTFNWYGGDSSGDFIKLAEANDKIGGSNDSKTRLWGVSDLYAEWRNAKRAKTGEDNFTNTYDRVMDDVSGQVYYRVKVGLWTQQQADEYKENISESLKSGKFFDRTKLNQN